MTGVSLPSPGLLPIWLLAATISGFGGSAERGPETGSERSPVAGVFARAEFASGPQQEARARAEAARRRWQQAQRSAQAAGAAGFDEAAPTLEAAIERGAAGQAALAAGDFAAAFEAYDAALTLAQQAISATSEAAVAARQQAEAASRAALESVDEAVAALDRARNLERRGRFNDARLAFLQATSLYEGATGTERALIEVLERYEQALEREDLDAFMALWVDIDEVEEHKVRESFDRFDSTEIQYTETVVVEQTADTATVRTVQQREMVFVQTGDRVPLVARYTFELRKRGGVWLIEKLTAEAINQ